MTRTWKNISCDCAVGIFTKRGSAFFGSVSFFAAFELEAEIKKYASSLKVGGTVLNLTAADAVIHYDPWWNLSAQNQPIDRTHRIGQKKSLNVYSLIMKNSIEERIMELKCRRRILRIPLLKSRMDH